MRLLILCCLVGLLLAKEEKVRYDGHQVLSVLPRNLKQLDALLELQATTKLNLEFWREPAPDRACDIHVTPESVKEVTTILNDIGVQYNVTINNLQELIDLEEMENKVLRLQAETDAEVLVPNVLGRYARLSELYAWMDGLVQRYPTLCKTESIGKSYGGRDVRLLTVSSGGSKPAIFVDATMHAREWITGGVITHCINQLLTSDAGRALMQRYDFYFVPVINPDGYEYTFTNNRMWRKTREPTTNARCPGTDLNRNFDYNWARGSSDPCSQTYKGSAPFSAVENRNLRDAILARASTTVAYLNLHSYGEIFLPPYMTTSTKPPDAAELNRIGNVAVSAIFATNGRRYRVAGSGGGATGIAIDWVKGVARVKYCYIIELRPPNAAGGGFILPPSQIVPNGQEIWNSIVAIAAELRP